MAVFSVMPKLQKKQSIYLRTSRDIEAVKRHGRRMSTTLFNLLAYKVGDEPSRVGIVVGKRFGDAVRRNRAKRIFRELVRQVHRDLVPARVSQTRSDHSTARKTETGVGGLPTKRVSSASQVRLRCGISACGSSTGTVS